MGAGFWEVRAPENEQLQHEGCAPRARGVTLAVRGGCFS